MGPWRRVRQVAVVGVVTISILAGCVAIYFRQTGVIASASKLDNLTSEANRLGLRLSPQPKSETISNRNAYPVVKDAMLHLEKILGKGFLYAESPKTASADYHWPEKTRRVFDEFQSDLDQLLKIDSTWSFEVPDEHRYEPSLIPERDLLAIQSFATAFANQGQDAKAAELYRLMFLLGRWKVYSMPSHELLVVMSDLRCLQPMSFVATIHGKKGPITDMIRILCKSALQPIDYRKMYQAMIDEFYGPLDTYLMPIQLDRLKNPDMRANIWFRVPLVRKAARADYLRMVLAGYRLVAKDPYSIDVAIDAQTKALGAQSDFNSLSEPILYFLKPIPVAKSIKPLLGQIRLIQQKYQTQP